MTLIKSAFASVEKRKKGKTMEAEIHILHLEDDPADAQLIQAMLAEAGLKCRITRTQTRDEFETALRDGRMQAILADYRLPSYDGMSALRLTRELCSDIPFIFVSGAMGEEAAINALTQGATDYVLKHNLSRLTPAVQRALQEAQNLSERKRAEAALKASEARYIDLYDNAPDMYASVNTQTARIDDCNQTLADTLGYSKAEIIGRAVFDIYHPDCRDQAKTAFRKFLENGAIHDTELQLHKKDGSTLDVSLNASAVRAEDGTILFGRSTLRDSTERRRNQMINAARIHLMQFAVTHSLDELLEETVNEVEKVTDSLIGFFVFVDEDQQMLTLQNWSTRTKARFCMAQGKGLHYPIADAGVWVECIRERKPVVHNDYPSLPHRRGLPDGHAEIRRELTVPVMRGGKIKAVLGVGNKPVDYNPKDVDAMSFLADLAWEAVIYKMAEEELRRSEEKYRRLNITLEKRVTQRTVELEHRAQKLQQLALELSGAEDRERRHIASILHDDFQQQLAYIKMELDLLRKTTEPEVGQTLGRLAELTGECIEKSRDLSYEINPPVLHRSGLLAALEALAKDLARNQEFTVIVQTQSNAEPASFSLASILYRSVRELLLNVAKHAGVNSAVIDVQGDDQQICIQVQDDGRGFDFDAVRSGQGKGAGFGLYNIEDRMDSLGGSMAVDTRPGHGCRVRLTVPNNIAPEPAIPSASLDHKMPTDSVDHVPDRTLQPLAGTERILILLADDHALMREALAKLLQECTDLSVVGQAVDGHEAVQMAAQLNPHVILMDVTMPGLDGFEATAQITRAHPDIRIIGLSMHNDADTRKKMLDAGASAYLTKTGSPDTLIETIRHLHHQTSQTHLNLP